MGWDKRFYPPIFPEQAEELRLMARLPLTDEDVSGLIDSQEIMQQYAVWKKDRDTKLFSS